jgi:molybdate transport system ATP-binding protein
MPLSIAVEHKRRDFTVDVAFEAPSPGITVLFGPSGCGKSTVLAAVAGLLRAKRVRVELNGEALDRLPPHRRRIALVFQDGRLFPHMTVEDNLLYGLHRAPKDKRKGLDKGRGLLHATEIADLLNLQHLRRRRPATLSGGERQRVAIGRALLSQPRLLLMDEPLASLDNARRDEILPYLQRLRDVMRMPVVYVTHAIDEAYRLADFLVLLEEGQVLAAGPMADLVARVDLPLAQRDDAAGVLLGYLHSHEPERGLSAIACGGQVYMVPQCDIAPGASVRLRVPAREVILSLDIPRNISVNNVISATVCALRQDATTHAVLVELDVGGGQLLARVTMDAAERLQLRPGVRVLALVKAMGVELLAG